MTIRTRSRDTRVEHIYIGDGLLCDGSPNGVIEIGHGVYNGIEETTKDVVTPNFHSRKAKGDIINNEFSSVKTEHSYSTTGWRVDKSVACSAVPGPPADWQSGTGYYALGVDKYARFAAPNTSRDAAQASLLGIVSTRALANVVPAEVQALVDLGERKQTMRLLRKPLGNLNKFISDVSSSRGFKKSPYKAVGNYISDSWLRYRYGVMPLLLSIDGTMKAVTADKGHKRLTARASQSDTLSQTTKVETTTGGAYFDSTTTATNDIKIDARAGILYEHNFSIADAAGTTFHELPSTIYELIPYSFVVDWLANVGDFIRAMTPKADVKTLASWTKVTTTTVDECTVTAVKAAAFPARMSVTIYPTGTYSRKKVEVYRHPGVSASIQHRMHQIDFDVPKDWLHLADTIALIVSKLSVK